MTARTINAQAYLGDALSYLTTSPLLEKHSVLHQRIFISWELSQGIQSIRESSLQYANDNALQLAKIYLSLILNDNISLFLNDNIDGKGMHDGGAEGNRFKKVKSEDTCDHSDKGEEDVEEEEARKNRLGLNKKSGDDDELIAKGKSYVNSCK
ncbi:uncharacterized protein A4U43_C04F3910 [Asparagus officinalis]|uniref:Uncharacterized protein n=1 Tax=Asparagus officinalis TaxID=4686 RepID=A0A5P1EYL0_ASPOF|nr:uncharacterized protein A4U43_C04F3910 [Asparagus officinalis]